MEKKGLFRLGYVTDLRGDLKRLSDMAGIEVTKDELDEWIESPNCTVEHCNGSGYLQSKDRVKVKEKDAKYIRFNTWLKDSRGDEIIGYFAKAPKGPSFAGVHWTSKAAFMIMASSRIGRMRFATASDNRKFVDKVAECAMPEIWEFKGDGKNKTNHPILRSFMAYGLERLVSEAENSRSKVKLIYNEDSTKVWFNTNLLDRYGHDLHLVGSIIRNGSELLINNVEIAPSKIELKKRWGFNTSTPPEVPSFFGDIDEIIFHHDWEIDKDANRYRHIVEERIGRFPARYRSEKTDFLANRLDSAIDLARRIAKRNFRFVVPIYYPRNNEISLVMPIYLDGYYSEHPDFGLVLTPHPNEKMYTMATILGLNEVYMDARLIAKPEEAWLKPDMIAEPTVEMDNVNDDGHM